MLAAEARRKASDFCPECRCKVPLYGLEQHRAGKRHRDTLARMGLLPQSDDEQPQQQLVIRREVSLGERVAAVEARFLQDIADAVAVTPAQSTALAELVAAVSGAVLGASDCFFASLRNVGSFPRGTLLSVPMAVADVVAVHQQPLPQSAASALDAIRASVRDDDACKAMRPVCSTDDALCAAMFVLPAQRVAVRVLPLASPIAGVATRHAEYLSGRQTVQTTSAAVFVKAMRVCYRQWAALPPWAAELLLARIAEEHARSEPEAQELSLRELLRRLFAMVARCNSQLPDPSAAAEGDMLEKVSSQDKQALAERAEAAIADIDAHNWHSQVLALKK